MSKDGDTSAFDATAVARTILEQCKTASLATVDDQGLPCAANIQFVSDDAMQLLWVSKPESQHSTNLSLKPDAAVTVYAHDDRAPNIHGLQLRGTVTVIEGGNREWHHAFEAYTAKYPFAGTMPQFREAIEKQAFYRFTPTWVRLVDNRQRFGFKVQWVIE